MPNSEPVEDILDIISPKKYSGFTDAHCGRARSGREERFEAESSGE
jgi:hypothetical protein